MDNSVIAKQAIAGFLDKLFETHQVYAPVERDGILGLELLRDAADVVLDRPSTRQASKTVFFPRSETLFTFRDGRVMPVAPLEQKRIVLGIRPCDARSAVLLDNLFDTADYQDPYYVNRRRNTVLIGLGCTDPLDTCFCTAVGGAPFGVDGLDMLWTDLGDRYLVEPLTSKGAALLEDHAGFRPATDEEVAQKSAIAAQARDAVTGPQVGGIKEKLDGLYEDPVWDEIHRKCLGCGACSYLCPTCHCFDIVDEGTTLDGRRVRNWDTCQFALFTHQGSGHNPRQSGKERMRQRVMHKFSYFVDMFGEIACVGCGRCVRECPVNMDIRTVLDTLAQVAGQ